MGNIGVSVIGVGNYGEVHARVYKNDPRVELISVWSRNKERSRTVGKKYDCHGTTDLKSIINDPRVNIVSIATPDFAHTEPAIKMMQVGKHVLIEKPMATSVRECEKMLKVQQENKVKLMVNFHNRWYKPVAEAKKMIDLGRIGKPIHGFIRLSDVITVATDMLSWSKNSGPEWFLFPHTVDLARWLFGQEVGQVFAVGKKGLLKSKGLNIFDVIQAQIIFENSIVVLESSWVLPVSWRNGLVEFKIDLYCEKGRIGITGDNEGLEVSSKEHRTPFLYDFITEEEPIKHFIDCVLYDKEPMINGKDGLEVTRVIDAIVRSIKENRVIRLK